MSAPREPEFMDPPPAFGRPQDEEWASVIAALIENTGRWARILIGDYKETGPLTGRIRKSRGGWAGHEWEVTTRNNGTPSAVHVYARHIKPLDTPTTRETNSSDG